MQDLQPYETPCAQPVTHQQRQLVHEAKKKMLLLENQEEIGATLEDWDTYIKSRSGQEFTREGKLYRFLNPFSSCQSEDETDDDEEEEEEKEEEEEASQNLEPGTEVAVKESLELQIVATKRPAESSTKNCSKKILISCHKDFEVKIVSADPEKNQFKITIEEFEEEEEDGQT